MNTKNKRVIQDFLEQLGICVNFMPLSITLLIFVVASLLAFPNLASARPIKPSDPSRIGGERKPIKPSPFSRSGSRGGGSCTLCDLDGNNHIAPYDQSRLMEILLGSVPTAQELCAGDFDHSGAINGLDIQQWVNQCQLECTVATQESACSDQNLCTTDTCDHVQGCQRETINCPVGQSCASHTGMCVDDLVVAHFNWTPPNQLGGNWGLWNAGGFEGCALVLDSDVSGAPNMFSQALEYNLSLQDQPYCGMWMHLGPYDNQGMPTPFDASSYKTMSFYVKGDLTASFTDKFIVELKNGYSTHPYLVQGITHQWQRYDIPLLAFTGGLDTRALTEFVTAFSHDYTYPPSGKISMDHITLSHRVTDLLIADFQIEWPNNYGGSASNLNNLRGLFGSWNRFPEDLAQSCTESKDGPDALGDSRGHSLRIDYDVDSTGDASCGFWMQTEVDSRDYRYIKFYVKSDGPVVDGVGIELKQEPYSSGFRHYVINGISNQWREVVIPLDYFRPLPSFTQLYQFVVVFEEGLSSNYEDVTPQQGRIYIDHVRLTER
ncbi:MAG: hypothetical protein HY582_02060 [Candidatus Omnitrophica bacterium]|nr:hypothetical protein [Candidatus Omnitrophota bacterium]